jgi:hypothetical protein
MLLGSMFVMVDVHAGMLDILCRNALIRCIGDVLRGFLDAALGSKPILVWVSQV